MLLRQLLKLVASIRDCRPYAATLRQNNRAGQSRSHALFRRRAGGGHLLAMTASAGEIARVEPFDVIELDIGDMFGVPSREP